MRKIARYILIFLLLATITPSVLGDISQCDSKLEGDSSQMIKESDYDRCIMDNLESASNCELIKRRSSNYDRCMEKYYSTVIDLEECETAPDEFYGECYGNIIARDATKDISACNDIVLAKPKEDCITNFIFKRGIKDANECLKIDGDDFQRHCAKKVVAKQGSGFNRPPESICDQYSGNLLAGCQDYFKAYQPGLKTGLTIFGGALAIVFLGLVGYSFLGLYFLVALIGIILVVTSKDKNKTNKILNLMVLPGLGSIIDKKTVQGVIQIILWAVGLIFITLYFTAILGLILVVVVYIWTIITTVKQSQSSRHSSK
ncbi:MAG: hypothetical protein KKG59_06170 [Nanoarchaeota archaeon]|nr:hypothetical protein [Nanoarchaeota archaeon]